MATLTLGTAGNYTWYLDYTTTQSVSLNQSTIAYTLRIHRNVSAGSGAFWGTPARSFNVTINGVSDTENFASIDFTAAADINFTSGSVVINHDADGTKSPVSVSASVTGSYVSAGFPVPTTLSGKTISLATIPRAATSIVRSASTETGSATTLTISPRVSTFYYVLKYKSPLTTTWTTIGASGGIVGTSWPYSTTISHGEIPNDTSGTIQFQVTTLDASGGTQIGTPVETSLVYTVPTSVVPTAGAPTWTEGATTTGLSTLTNSAAVFCQGWSRLVPTFTATAGTGASVSTAQATVSGVSGTTTSGVAFTNAVTSQGVASTFSVAVTDSRGRTDTETGTVSPSVHRWSLPTANPGTAVVTPTGATQTLALSGLQATTTSFYLSGAQRNTLQTRLGYRDITSAGAWTYGSWTTQALSGSDSTDNAYAPGTPITVATGLDPTHEYEVALQVRDIFGANSVNYSTGAAYISAVIEVPAQNVLIAYDGNTRVGIRKIPTQGALDISGDAYADNFFQSGLAVLDTSDLPVAASETVAGIVELATSAETTTGTDTTRAVTPAGAAAAYGMGYRLADVREYTSGATFSKGDYPYLRAVRVRVQSGGGGGGGCAAAGSGAHTKGGGGGAGAYAEAFITDIVGMASSVTVTVGAAGSGGAAGNNAGGTGGTSSFGSYASAGGASGGAGGASSTATFGVAGGNGGVATAGDIQIGGGDGGFGFGGASLPAGGVGSTSPMGGGGGRGPVYGTAAQSGAGNPATGYGGGGGGAAASSTGAAAAGGAGGAGIVIVEVYA